MLQWGGDCIVCEWADPYYTYRWKHMGPAHTNVTNLATAVNLPPPPFIYYLFAGIQRPKCLPLRPALFTSAYVPCVSLQQGDKTVLPLVGEFK